MKTFIYLFFVLFEFTIPGKSFEISEQISNGSIDFNFLNEYKVDIANNKHIKTIKPSHNNQWRPIGVDIFGNTNQWINPKSYRSLNKDSFRMSMKWDEVNKPILGRIDINCRNKDYYIRKKREMSQRGTWYSISKGSSIEELAMIYCKRTSAASIWGYTAETKYLWGNQKPNSTASNIDGEWISVYKNRLSEFQYNSNIKKKGDYVFAAYYLQKNIDHPNSNYISSKSRYGWIAVSCTENLHSIFLDIDSSISGEWMSPIASRPGGGAWEIRKVACTN